MSRICKFQKITPYLVQPDPLATSVFLSERCVLKQTSKCCNLRNYGRKKDIDRGASFHRKLKGCSFTQIKFQVNRVKRTGTIVLYKHHIRKTFIRDQYHLNFGAATYYQYVPLFIFYFWTENTGIFTCTLVEITNSGFPISDKDILNFCWKKM